MPHHTQQEGTQLQPTDIFFTVTSTVQAQSCFCLHLCHGCKSKRLQKSKNKSTSQDITAVLAGTGAAFLTKYIGREAVLGIVLVRGLRKGVVGADGQPSLNEHTALPRASLSVTWAHACSVCKGSQLCWLNC